MLSTLGSSEKTASQGLSPGACRLAGKVSALCTASVTQGTGCTCVQVAGEGKEAPRSPAAYRRGGDAVGQQELRGGLQDGDLGSCIRNEGCVHQTGFSGVVYFGLFKSHKRSPLEETHLTALSVRAGGYLHFILSFKKSCRQTSRRPRSWSPLGSQPLCHSL